MLTSSGQVMKEVEVSVSWDPNCSSMPSTTVDLKSIFRGGLVRDLCEWIEDMLDISSNLFDSNALRILLALGVLHWKGPSLFELTYEGLLLTGVDSPAHSNAS